MKCPVCTNELHVTPKDKRSKFANCVKCSDCGLGLTPSAWSYVTKRHQEQKQCQQRLREIEEENANLQVRLSESREMLARRIQEGDEEPRTLPPSHIGELVGDIAKRAVGLSICKQQGPEKAREYLGKPSTVNPSGN